MATVTFNIRDFAFGERRKSMERLILSCPWRVYAAKKAYEYSKRIIGGPWPQGERKILKSPYYSYLYARYVLKAPWPKAEKMIARDAHSSYMYARHVIKRRFELAENNKSANGFSNSRWDRAKNIYLYSKYVIKGRWEKMEKKMADGDAKNLCLYAVNILKSRWKRVEPTIAKSEYIGEYVKVLKPEEFEDFRNLLLMEALVEYPDWQTNYAKNYLKSLKPDEKK